MVIQQVSEFKLPKPEVSNKNSAFRKTKRASLLELHISNIAKSSFHPAVRL